MAFDILHNLGEKSGILDRRFLLGVFFPEIIGITIIYVITLKQLPVDFISWFYIVFIAFGISLLFIEISPKACWYVSRAEKQYYRFLNDNVREIFVTPHKNVLNEYNMDIERFVEKITLELKAFKIQAKEDYLNNFFMSERRYNHSQLVLYESRFLFILNIFIVMLFSIIVLTWIRYFDLYILSFYRDKITPNTFAFGTILLGIICISCFLLEWYQARTFWRQIIKSCNVPFVEFDHEREIRETGLNVVLNFDHDNSAFSSRKKLENKFDIALEPVKRMIAEDEYKYRSRIKIEEILFQKFLNKYKSELNINQIQISQLSKNLAKQQVSISNKIQLLNTQEIMEIYNTSKDYIFSELLKPNLTIIVQRGIIVEISSLLDFIFEQILGQRLSNFNRVLYIIKEASQNLLSEDEIENLKNFRIIRNGFIHSIKNFKILTKSEIEVLTQDIFKTLEKLLSNRIELSNEVLLYLPSPQSYQINSEKGLFKRDSQTQLIIGTLVFTTTLILFISSTEYILPFLINSIQTSINFITYPSLQILGIQFPLMSLLISIFLIISLIYYRKRGDL